MLANYFMIVCHLGEQQAVKCCCVRYLKPGVYLDGLDALHQGLVDFGPVAVVKPQSQNPKKRQ